MKEGRLLSAREIVSRVKSGELKVTEIVESTFDRVSKTEDRLNCYVTILQEEALKRARLLDESASKGKVHGRLFGVPVAVKDNICTKGVRTTCSSRILANFKPVYNATVIERLEREGAVIIGKTNMDEFAMGVSTETSYFGPTRNPWDLTRVPGGSSGGSAAAVAAGEATVALGSDTGGSIRCPASFCSIVGLKPTYGSVSRYGLIAYANSLEQIGPMARDVYDCALLFSVIAGHDPRDSTSVNLKPKDYTVFLREEVKGVKIGVPKEFFGEGTQKVVEETVWKAVHKLEDLGAEYDTCSLPSLEYALAAYYIIAMSEASSNLARYDGLRYGYSEEFTDTDWFTYIAKVRRNGFGPEVRRRIILGTFTLSSGYYNRYYLKALKVRTLIRMDFEKAFKRFDVLAAPTMPTPPFKLGEKIENPLELYMCDIDTVPANLAGLPSISIPCGFTTSGLPVGLQLIAPPFREDLLFRVAYTFEKNTGYVKEEPEVI
ncbi:Asp-tRNA(Asn)/Glu-tRNA(Gln) amidotransferase GatCAB subunit A [Candidatus Bathyarchaeota archaeon B24-2]|nr:MAG: Asp-tRNA(Asn)/Glu-tRNA(Gln) amidotransferase GatCAB subunit A [Candidatus Bathyarchaeota archaeon B24-2]